ncbi:MerR family transcriptional regulator [Streptomyces sp. NPDC086023]|uniref:helix-turn-helix domain-containing protein n=1 Tax=Streptomyces sp. NPDC086023 TaxID=3365746 RepID=UPI0037D0CA4F
MFSSHDGLCSIGELAERAGTTVKSVRFYSDSGLLPEAARSAGGHRRYGPEAVGRLELIRSLRALGLPVAEVRRVLEEDEGAGAAGATGGVLEDAVAGHLRELGSQLKALRWREAALRLVHESPPGERAERLRLLGAVSASPNTAPLARFWRAWLPPRMSAPAASAFLELAVPQPPDDPAPAQVLAFARLYAFASAPCTGGRPCRPEAHRSVGAREAAVLYGGLAEAYELAGAQLLRDREPRPGEALDCFVAAYASASGTRDTPGFRRVLAGRLAADPRLDGYWELVSGVLTPPGTRPAPTPGGCHDWLLAALGTEHDPEHTPGRGDLAGTEPVAEAAPARARAGRTASALT